MKHERRSTARIRGLPSLIGMQFFAFNLLLTKTFFMYSVAKLLRNAYFSPDRVTSVIQADNKVFIFPGKGEVWTVYCQTMWSPLFVVSSSPEMFIISLIEVLSESSYRSETTCLRPSGPCCSLWWVADSMWRRAQ